ncbi:MAG: hypothetical protein HRT89_09415 [Lentisphaeria bacterium]|nr:hypothetical protein [Lentisphaeria bacterium]
MPAVLIPEKKPRVYSKSQNIEIDLDVLFRAQSPKNFGLLVLPLNIVYKMRGGQTPRSSVTLRMNLSRIRFMGQTLKDVLDSSGNRLKIYAVRWHGNKIIQHETLSNPVVIKVR